MAVAKVDSGSDAVNGGSVILCGRTTQQYVGRGQVIGDPASLLTTQVQSSRFAAGSWRGEVQPATADDVDSATNDAAVVTYEAETYRRHVIFGIAWSYDAEPTGGGLTVAAGDGNIVFQVEITAAGPGVFRFPEGLKGVVGASFTVTLAAGGADVTGDVTVLGHRVE